MTVSLQKLQEVMDGCFEDVFMDPLEALFCFGTRAGVKLIEKSTFEE